MIRALVRVLLRGVLVLAATVAVIAAVVLYRSGRLPFQAYQRTIQDAAIVASAKAAYALHRQLAHRAIRIESRDGEVVLQGEVASAAEKGEADQIVRGIQGVRAVDNRLRIDGELGTGASDPRSLGEALDDITLLAKVRAALSLDREAKRLDLEVTVRDGTVFLAGSVPSQELERRVVQRVESVSGVKAVENGILTEATSSLREP